MSPPLRLHFSSDRTFGMRTFFKALGERTFKNLNVGIYQACACNGKIAPRPNWYRVEAIVRITNRWFYSTFARPSVSHSIINASKTTVDLITLLLTIFSSETASMKLMFASKIFITFIKNIRVSSEALAITLLDRWRETLDSAVAPILLPFLSAASSNKKHKHKQKCVIIQLTLIICFLTAALIQSDCMRLCNAFTLSQHDDI